MHLLYSYKCEEIAHSIGCLLLRAQPAETAAPGQHTLMAILLFQAPFVPVHRDDMGIFDPQIRVDRCAPVTRDIHAVSNMAGTCSGRLRSEHASARRHKRRALRGQKSYSHVLVIL
jgi:hypothetical protein